jgi:hypothetical protein
VFQDCQTDLQHLAGGLRYLGANYRAASTVDLAFLARTTGIIFGSIHGAHICEVEGVPVSEFTAILPTGDRAVPLTQAINDGSFTTISASGASVRRHQQRTARSNVRVDKTGSDSRIWL